MEKSQGYVVATYVLDELKKNLKLANSSNILINQIHIFETETSWCVSVPERVYNRKLYVKGLRYNESKNFVEQSIVNAIRKYLISIGEEGTVSVA